MAVKFQAVRSVFNRGTTARDRRTAEAVPVRQTFYRPPTFAPPTDLSQRQCLQIAAAAQWLSPLDRDQFWAAVAKDLKGSEVTDAGVTRAIVKAFRVFYRPLKL